MASPQMYVKTQTITGIGTAWSAAVALSGFPAKVYITRVYAEVSDLGGTGATDLALRLVEPSTSFVIAEYALTPASPRIYVDSEEDLASFEGQIEVQAKLDADAGGLSDAEVDVRIEVQTRLPTR